MPLVKFFCFKLRLFVEQLFFFLTNIGWASNRWYVGPPLKYNGSHGQAIPKVYELDVISCIQMWRLILTNFELR